MTDSDQATAPGLSVFFPAYNDCGTIASLVITAVQSASKLTANYEVIVVDDGSSDSTAQILSELARVYPRLKIVTHPVNRGYGGALRTGFASAAKDVIFYTDGDAQYDAREAAVLVPLATRAIDIVQGYKVGRGDPWYRKIIGRVYHHAVKLLFGLRVRDTDCDFRLFRRQLFTDAQLTSTSGVICVEMMFRFQRAGARFVEAPVHHYFRPHGRSQFFRVPALARSVRQLLALWWRLVIRGR
jgi:glycosyltransferase involved in cell wall biosynthesis